MKDSFFPDSDWAAKLKPFSLLKICQKYIHTFISSPDCYNSLHTNISVLSFPIYSWYRKLVLSFWLDPQNETTSPVLLVLSQTITSF